MRSSSSDDAMNGGTVSMCVEKTISGRACPGHVASTFARAPSTGIFRASIPRRCSSSQRKSPTAFSFGVMDSMSIRRRASANRSMQKKRNSPSRFVDSAELTVERRDGRGRPSLHSPLLYPDSVLPETSSIRSLFIAGPTGRLEALLNGGSPSATHAALVCHPHPLFGGTLHNKVVFHAMKALSRFGFPVLRFNFRGTGLSEGEHAGGIGEVEDVRAALDWLEHEFTLPVIFAGFSFGAAVGSRAAYSDDRVRALIALGLPAVPIEGRVYDFEFLRACTKPKLFVSGSRDQFGPPGKLEALVNTFADPKNLVRIEAGDHFFEGRLKEMRVAIEDWLRETVLTKAIAD